MTQWLARSAPGLAIAGMLVMHSGLTAQAAEIEEFFGVWGDAEGGYDCKGEPGSEVMPVSIGRDEHGEISVGAYAWLCSAKEWQRRGAFLWAEATCGHEGDAETTGETLELAIANYGRLVLVRDTTVDVLEKCPAAN